MVRASVGVDGDAGVTKALTIHVDGESLDAAFAALPGQNIHHAGCCECIEGAPDLILSTKARYFEPEWWSDPKLVEAALKRARAEKRKRGKKDTK